MPTGQEEPQQGMSWIKKLMLFMSVQFFIGQIANRFKKTDSGIIGPDGQSGAEQAVGADGQPLFEYSPVPHNVFPYWAPSTQYDVRLFLSDDEYFDDWEAQPFLSGYNLTLGDTDYKIATTGYINTTESQRNNGSVSAHLYMSKSGSIYNPTAVGYDPGNSYSLHFRLSHYMPQKKVKKQKLLIGSSDSDEEVEEPEVSGSPSIISLWHPNITLGVVPSGRLDYISMAPPIRQWVALEPTGIRDKTGKDGYYYPIVFYNQFWQLTNQMSPINETVTQLPISITFAPEKFWKFQIMTSFDAGLKMQLATNQPGANEMEELKRVIIDTNIYLLGITVGVSVLHMLFEMLAFKNDISHWKNKQNQVGTSVRTIIANVVMQTIIFLYLIDNSDNTSWMIMFTQASGILVEAWKITKVMDFKIEPTNGIIPYKLTITDKHELNEIEKKTQEYDQIAFKYLYIACVPLLLAYAVYSLMYEPHKSWYSFIIATLVGSVYAYGFLMLVPSIYINYRLKSVAHMPRRAMIYKFLNTFIDDLFAFVIKMPILHRIATLRDDVIFFIYLYQTWLYRVDPTRVNEFGQVLEEENKKDESEEVTDAPVEGVASSAEPVESEVTKRK
ncbi:cleft lip and palate transmembrane protein 1-domain-containing protein [Lipomyces arxii]|uniref:cleft lip and palate transmembrane protein 1-domain-containing protein n=1 Tax=Lipomyces arxii TaxID=56418 RepID=UPI0034CEE88C